MVTGTKNFLSLDDLEKDEIDTLLQMASKFKKEPISKVLQGKTLLNLLLKPSLRNRTSVQAAMQQLGGMVVDINSGKGHWPLDFEEGAIMDGATSEHVQDAAGVLSQYGDILSIRTAPGMESVDEDQQDIAMNAFAKHSQIPILNLESAWRHPCQGLTDWMTVRELDKVKTNHKIVLTWTWHPLSPPHAVPNSFLSAASRMGKDVVLACPQGYELHDRVMSQAKNNCAFSGGSFSVSHNMEEAMGDADVIYAKSWVSVEHYGDHAADQQKKENLKHWIVDKAMMDKTNDASFMHCLPIRRNVVATDDVLNSSANVSIAQAGNHLPVKKALLAWLLSE